MYGHSMGYKHSMLTDDLLKRKLSMIYVEIINILIDKIYIIIL